ncbi:MAG: hypothetical protein AAFQ94_14895 [Bacteroidota bacterium]
MIFGKKAIPNVFLRYLMDFLIVFAGVYGAFLLSNYQVDINNAKERDKILAALKIELEQFRVFMSDQSEFQQEKVQEWDSLFLADQYINFNGWRYLEPQYNYRIIEYAMNREGTDIIDFELFKELQFVYNSIRRLEHAERLMTEFANKREMNPSNDPKKNQNRFYFYKFINFARDRAGIQQRLGKSSADVVELINDRLTDEKRAAIESEFICLVLKNSKSESIKSRLKKGFPKIDENDWEDIFSNCAISSDK